MSVIIHRCGCGHIDMSHSDVHGKCSYGYCSCTKNRSQVGGPSEVLPTYGDGGTPVETITKPGAIFGSTLGGASKTCACPSCAALFDAEVSA